MYFFFFFSSRRRHTRLQGDWSSDVCSSDLILRRLDGDPRLDLGAVRALLRGGFGSSRAGEDPFDATTACIALARLVLDGAVPEAPAVARAVEGWILGLAPS